MPKTPAIEPKRNRELKETSILDAACEIFSQKGYELTTTKEIASKAGCAEGLIFKYFEGKEKLLVKLMERGLQRAQKELLNLPEISNSLEEDLLIIANWMAKSFSSERRMFIIYLSQRLSCKTCITQSIVREEFIKTRLNVIVSRLKKHQEAGHMAKNINLHYLFEHMHSYIHYLIVILPVYSQGEMELEEVKIKQFVHILSQGLC